MSWASRFLLAREHPGRRLARPRHVRGPRSGSRQRLVDSDVAAKHRLGRLDQPRRPADQRRDRGDWESSRRRCGRQRLRSLGALVDHYRWTEWYSLGGLSISTPHADSYAGDTYISVPGHGRERVGQRSDVVMDRVVRPGSVLLTIRCQRRASPHRRVVDGSSGSAHGYSSEAAPQLAAPEFSRVAAGR
jgi:hypothetical protein